MGGVEVHALLMSTVEVGWSASCLGCYICWQKDPACIGQTVGLGSFMSRLASRRLFWGSFVSRLLYLLRNRPGVCWISGWFGQLHAWRRWRGEISLLPLPSYRPRNIPLVQPALSLLPQLLALEFDWQQAAVYSLRRWNVSWPCRSLSEGGSAWKLACHLKVGGGLGERIRKRGADGNIGTHGGGSTGWRQLRNEDLHNWYWSSDIGGGSKCRKMKWVGRYMGISDHLHLPYRFSRSSHWLEVWVDQRTHPETVDKRKIPCC